MIEEKALTADLGIADPVAELKAVSHDPSLTHLHAAARRPPAHRARPAVGVLRAGQGLRATSATAPTPTSSTADVLDRWEGVLDQLGRDPMLCADELDWVAKLRLLEGYRERENLGWASHKLQLVDLQYSDVRPEKGLYHRLVARGSMKTLLDRRGDPRARWSSRRRTPGPTSAAAAWPSTRPRWSRRAGTRSSSTWAASRSSGCR